MFLPPVLRPLAVPGPVDPVVQGIAEAPFSMIRGVPGSYAAERLAGVLDSWQRLADSVWLRAADARPAGLADSLAEACRYRWPAAGLDAAPEGAVVVLELGGRWTAATGRLLRALRPPVTERRIRVVVVTETRFAPPPLLSPDRVLSATRLAARPEPGALGEAYDGLLRVAGRRPAVLGDVAAAARVWSPDPVTEALATTHGFPSFVERLTALLVARLTPEQRSALEVAAAGGYWHPLLGSPAVGTDELRPWLVPLEQQWGWLRPVWAPALRRELARQAVRPGRRGSPVSVLPARTRLEVRLLGPFEVRVDGTEVSGWRGRRGPSVLRYLLARQRHECTRDELIEEFWPDADTAAARNRLQVAVSGVRRAFGQVTPLNLIEYTGARYRLNPDVEIELDVESFERELSAGSAAERAGDDDAAELAYRRAVALYRGDFAADAPFESWTLLPRESLRLRQIDALDRLSRLELSAGRVDDCVATAHRMLDLDPCREDAHRLLMRLYARQGRPYLALRQYELCRRMLRGTVDVPPARETTVLFEAIKSGWPASRSLS